MQHATLKGTATLMEMAAKESKDSASIALEEGIEIAMIPQEVTRPSCTIDERIVAEDGALHTSISQHK